MDFSQSTRLSRRIPVLRIRRLLSILCATCVLTLVASCVVEPDESSMQLMAQDAPDDLAEEDPLAGSDAATDDVDPDATSSAAGGAEAGDDAAASGTGTDAATDGDDVEEPEATVEPEPIVREPIDQATIDAYYASSGPAQYALGEFDVYRVSLERTLRSDGLFDLSSSAESTVDKGEGTVSIDYELSGTTWELARSRELSTPPWDLIDAPSGAVELDAFRRAAFVVEDPLAGFGNTLSVDFVVGSSAPGVFELEVPHERVLAWRHGDWFSPWTSIRFINERVNRTTLQGTTPITLTFTDQLLRRVDIDYTPLIEDANASGQVLPIAQAVFNETYDIVWATGAG